jgi:predicted AAA+ superfamily ATPase
MKTYHRHLEKELKSLFFKGKALILIGARQVGKTTLLKSLSQKKKDILWIDADLHEVRKRLDEPSLESLKKMIGTYKFVIIDEIQRVRNAGLLLKILVDNFKGVQFIATGSSSLEISEFVFEPLTGRQFLFHLFPFAMSEIYSKKSPFEVEQKLPFHLIYGSYPEVSLNPVLAEKLLINLSQQYLYRDVLIWKDIRKPELLDKLLRLLAYQVGSEVSLNELAKQLKVKQTTVDTYIDLLEKSFVIFRMNSYVSNFRKEVSKMGKIYFWDNGIRNSVIGDFRDISLRNDLGALFENFIISERLKMNSWFRPQVKSYFWRNYNQSEVDLVEVKSGKLFAYEIKWNTRKKQYVSKAFTNMYPDAHTQVINPDSFYDFLFER